MSAFNDFAKISFLKLRLRKKRFIFTIVGVSAGIAILAMGFALLDGGVRYMKRQTLSSILPREFIEIKVSSYFPYNEFSRPYYFSQAQEAMLAQKDLKKINDLFPSLIVSPYLSVQAGRIISSKYAADKTIEEDPELPEYQSPETIYNRSDILLARDARDLKPDFTYGDLKYEKERKKKLAPFTIEGVSRPWINSYLPELPVKTKEDEDAAPILLSTQTALTILDRDEKYLAAPVYDPSPIETRLSGEDKTALDALVGEDVYIFLRPPQTERYFEKYNGKVLTAKIAGIIPGYSNFIPYETAQELQGWLIMETKTAIAKEGKNDKVDPQDPFGLPFIFVLAESVDEVKDAVKILKDNQYNAASYLDRIALIEEGAAFLRRILYVMSAVIIVLVVLLIMNTLGKIIHDSTKEIGIFRALGAKKKHIVKIFMIEAMMMAYISAVIGIALGWSASILASFGLLRWAFASVPYSPYEAEKIPKYFIGAPVYYYLAIFCATLILAAVTGYARARQASSLRIVDALREEKG